MLPPGDVRVTGSLPSLEHPQQPRGCDTRGHCLSHTGVADRWEWVVSLWAEQWFKTTIWKKYHPLRGLVFESFFKGILH